MKKLSFRYLFFKFKNMGNILHLSLKKKSFEVMVTGEKKEEYRKPNNWIKTRLFKMKENTLFEEIKDFKKYDYVKFVNGYGSDKPYFICEYLGVKEINFAPMELEYSNGLQIDVDLGDYEILLGAIIEVGNYNLEQKKPFCNGSQYWEWQDANCLKCSKYESKSKTIKQAKCKYAFQFDLASVSSGKVPIHVINETGLNVNVRCSHFNER